MFSTFLKRELTAEEFKGATEITIVTFIHKIGGRISAKIIYSCPMFLSDFHPITRAWFERTFTKPTEAQIQAWPAIKKGRHTLISAPTGSGKTLAAFYAAIDELNRLCLIQKYQNPFTLFSSTLLLYSRQPAPISFGVIYCDNPQQITEDMPPVVVINHTESSQHISSTLN